MSTVDAKVLKGVAVTAYETGCNDTLKAIKKILLVALEPFGEDDFISIQSLKKTLASIPTNYRKGWETDDEGV